jgi:DNA repair protein RecO
MALSNQVVSRGIVLSRTDFGEADRILTFLTPDQGKVRAMAKGVRKSKSKLAGGIELFSVSEITFIRGRGEINTLISTRLVKHYGDIVKDLERTNAGYELIRIVNKTTEDQPEEAYFDLLAQCFAALADNSIPPALTQLWFSMQLLKLSGHKPDLQTDINDEALDASKKYNFDFDHMKFSQAGSGFSANQIKFLRLGFQAPQPQLLSRVGGSENLMKSALPLVQTLLSTHINT